jgi:2-polyprenyl-3-methyl-5-hydroxy-6-metoxy-1,4-benzoquinol methylase
MDQAEWDERYAGAELLWSAEPNRFVAAELASLPAGRALDLGAGEGRNAIWLAGRGWKVTAVDFSAVALERGAALAARKGVSVEWVKADLRTYEPAAAAYDLVLIVYMHFPRPDLSRMMAAASSALAPGGTLFIIGHDRENITRGYGGPQDPGRLYTPELLTSELKDLTILRAEQVNRLVVADDGEHQAVDTLLRARR